jgi:hypothetical protein
MLFGVWLAALKARKNNIFCCQDHLELGLLEVRQVFHPKTSSFVEYSHLEQQGFDGDLIACDWLN